MSESTENLVLEILHQLRNDLTALRSEVRDGFNRVELRLGLVEQGLSSALSVSASDRDEIRVPKLRIERIERRLDLQGRSLPSGRPSQRLIDRPWGKYSVFPGHGPAELCSLAADTMAHPRFRGPNAAHRTVHVAFETVEAHFRTSTAGFGSPGSRFRTSAAGFGKPGPRFRTSLARFRGMEGRFRTREAREESCGTRNTASGGAARDVEASIV